MTIADLADGLEDAPELVETLAELSASLPFNRHLGVEIRAVAPGRAVVALPHDERLENHIGTPHAIAQLAPAELAGALAAGSRMGDLLADGWVPVIAGLNARYHAPAPDDLVASAEVSEAEAAAARAEAADGGRVRLAVEIHITAAGEHAPGTVGGGDVATMTGYYVLLPPDQAEQDGQDEAEAPDGG